MAICRSVCDGTDESRVGIFEGLAANKQRHSRVVRSTNRILLLTSKLAWSLEVDAKIREVAFIVLAHIFYGVDVERHCKPVNR